MVQIKIQEAEAYDRISILEIKLKYPGNYQIRNSLAKQLEELESRTNSVLGYDRAVLVHKSVEYATLYKCNEKIFYLIDSLNRYTETQTLTDEEKSRISYLGLDINFTNYGRHLAKKNLQAKFFGDILEEEKVGY